MSIILSPEVLIDLNEAPFKTEGLRAFVAGQTGAGKSYTLMKLVEEAASAGLQFVLLDPHGEGHVLSELGDTVLVASERVGIPVVEEAIPVYVDILKGGQSLVLDLSKLFYKAKSQFNRFIEEFIRSFLSEWSDIRRPILFVMDEAHVFAPQSKEKGSINRVELCGELATGGRKLGIMLCFATQRPAKIDKTVISQANVRLVGKLTATQDWSAFKDYFGKEIKFSDVRDLSSGHFFSLLGSEVTKTLIDKRITTDAGATPDAEPVLTTKQKMNTKELAERIEKALKKVKEERDKSVGMEVRIKTLEKSIEKHKDDKSELRKKLELKDLVVDMFDKVKIRSSDGKSIEVPQEFMDVKEEFDAEIEKLRKKMQKEMKEKDKTIQYIEVCLKENVEETAEYHKFFDLLAKLLQISGVADIVSSEVARDTGLEDRIIQKVLSRVGTDGVVFEVAPLEVLSKEWDRKALDRMIALIDELSSKGTTVLSCLVATSTSHRKTSLCEKLFGASSGSTYTSFKEALKYLIEVGLAKEDGHGVKSNLDKFVNFHMEGHSGDTENITHHLIEHIRSKTS